MAPVIAAVAISGVAGAISLAIPGTTATLAGVVGSTITTGVLSGLSYLLQDKPGAAGSAGEEPPRAAPANAFRTLTVRQAIPPRRYVLGKVRTAGVLFFHDHENPDMYVGTLLSDGVIEEVSAVYVGETAIPLDGSGDAEAGTAYEGHLNVEYGLGTDDQAASAALLTAFAATLSSDFRQRGIARAVATLDWGADATDHQVLWGSATQPTYLVCGVKVFDQREVAHDIDDRSTWEYSTNPAWLIAFALLSAWDVAIDDAYLDLDSFEAAADTFDATLSYGAETVKIFELAGVFQSGHQLASQLDDMLRSCGAALTFEDGKYGLAVDEAKTSVWTITDDDLIDVEEYTAAGRTDETPTAVKARYFDQTLNGQQSTTPIYEHSAVATEGYRESVLDLGYCPRSHSAQILAYRELIKARDGRELTMTLSDAAIYLQPLDRVTVSFTHASFLNGEYTVVGVDLAQIGCIVSLRGYDANAYATPSTYLV